MPKQITIGWFNLSGIKEILYENKKKEHKNPAQIMPLTRVKIIGAILKLLAIPQTKRNIKIKEDPLFVTGIQSTNK